MYRFYPHQKNKQISYTFAGEGGMDSLRQTLDHKPIHLSAVCAYLTKNSRTALQIENISEVPNEEEILILPFSAFEITSIKQYNGIMIEIELEECDETM